jgi:hypothetical protein
MLLFVLNLPIDVQLMADANGYGSHGRQARYSVMSLVKKLVQATAGTTGGPAGR